MMVYRFASELYKEDISGNGAALYGGRWNSKGMPVLYTSNHISLSVLELLVHNSNFLTLRNPFLISISIPDDIAWHAVHLAQLPKDWHMHPAHTQKKGDQFLMDKKVLILQVPSSIIPQENNYLINPSHRDFKKIGIVNTSLFELDKRLLNQ